MNIEAQAIAFYRNLSTPVLIAARQEILAERAKFQALADACLAEGDSAGYQEACAEEYRASDELASLGTVLWPRIEEMTDAELDMLA